MITVTLVAATTMDSDLLLGFGMLAGLLPELTRFVELLGGKSSTKAWTMNGVRWLTSCTVLYKTVVL